MFLPPSERPSFIIIQNKREILVLCICIYTGVYIYIYIYIYIFKHIEDYLWIKPTDALNSNFIGITTLHVSGRFSAHHQEFLVVHQFWYILCSCDEPFATRSSIERIDYLPKGQTINAGCYWSLLVQLKDIFMGKRRGKFTNVVLFLHYNAPVHRALATQKKLAYLGFQYLNTDALYFALYCILCWICRSQWPRGLRRRFTAARPLRLWVRIPPVAWMFVCCECCVFLGRGLCDGLITRPEESYRLWRVVVCDL